jgi:hypothetical protein
MTLLEATHLYRMPAGEYSSTGRRTVGYDLYKAADHGYPDLKDRIIPSSIAAQDVAGDYDILEDVDYMEEMPVANVSIVSPDMLKNHPPIAAKVLINTKFWWTRRLLKIKWLQSGKKCGIHFCGPQPPAIIRRAAGWLRAPTMTCPPRR